MLGLVPRPDTLEESRLKDCSACPSFVQDQDEIRKRFKRPTGVGAPMCGRYGHVLGFPGQQDTDAKNLRMAFAERCDAFGEELPAKPVSIRPLVATVSESVILDGPTGMEVGSCHGCQNLVKPDVVHTTWKWPLPVCKARGILVFEPTKECQGCQWANPGMPSEDLFGIDLRSEYKPGFQVNPERMFKATIENGNLNIEPTAYVTDAEVEPEDAADGIRAWRRLICPWGTGKEVLLPIFNRDHFPPELQELIPTTGDPNHPELYVDYSHLLWRFAVSSWTRGKTLFIQSLPGLGKTQFGYWLGWLMQLPVTRIFHTDSIEWDDIFGKVLFLKGETVWQDGRFTEAWKREGIIIVDEPNMARSELIATYRTTTEKDPVLYLDAGIGVDENGEHQRMKLQIRAHKYCIPVWCGNPAWDPRNIGTKELAAADISRLAPAVLEPPPAAIEKHIIRSTVHELEGFDIPEKLLDELMRASADLREASKENEYPGTWGIRENIDVAGNLAWYPFVEAFRMSALNYFEPDTAAFIVGLISQINPADVTE